LRSGNEHSKMARGANLIQGVVMRCLALAGTLLVVVTVAFGISAHAAPKAKAQSTRYCAMYKGGGENCGFLSLDQCRQSLAGNGGMCVVAAIQDPRIKNPAAVTPMNRRDEEDTE
jgi:Protein of unknown function (DUF3551)